MIGRQYRFHGYGSLRYVYQKGKTIRGPFTALKYAPNSRRSKYRLAVVVSKKVNKSAVVRNRIRRRVYEAFRQNINPDQAYDLVFTVFSEQIADMPADKLHQLVADQLHQISPDFLKVPTDED